MKFKKYFKYLVIFIVLGLIAVSIILTVNRMKQREVIEEYEEVGVVEEEPEIKEIMENYYVSDSVKFKNYSFICPDGWILFEEDNGSRVLIKNKSLTGKSLESIFILVEKLSDINKTGGSGDILDKYLETADKLEEVEIIEEETIYIDGIKASLTGYKYNSLLDEETEEIDLISYFEEDGYVYVIKYIGSNTDFSQAKDTYKNFVSTFSFDSNFERVKEEDKKNSINILIMGDDSGLGRAGGRVSGRTDIIMLLHINLDTHYGTIITIPRDTWVDIPGHGEGKINGAHAIGGIELALETVEQFSGLDIDNYIITDMDGFILLIDFLGGVTIEVTEDLADGFSGCYLDKGIHHLDGEKVLALSRNRHREGGAYARERESARIILALYEQNISFKNLIKLPAYVNFLLEYTWSDFRIADIIKMLPVLGKIKPQDIEIRTIPSWPQMVGNASAVVYDEEATRELFEEIKNQ